MAGFPLSSKLIAVINSNYNIATMSPPTILPQASQGLDKSTMNNHKAENANKKRATKRLFTTGVKSK
jgi:hypothetical protein